MGKGGIAGYEYFLPFPTMFFQKASSSRSLTSQDCAVKNLALFSVFCTTLLEQVIELKLKMKKAVFDYPNKCDLDTV